MIKSFEGYKIAVEWLALYDAGLLVPLPLAARVDYIAAETRREIEAYRVRITNDPPAPPHK